MALTCGGTCDRVPTGIQRDVTGNQRRFGWRDMPAAVQIIFEQKP